MDELKELRKQLAVADKLKLKDDHDFGMLLVGEARKLLSAAERCAKLEEEVRLLRKYEKEHFALRTQLEEDISAMADRIAALENNHDSR